MSQLKPRPYQEEALARAKEHNILLVLPTNAGKTYIAAQLVNWYLREKPCSKIVFLAPNQPLVEQQATVLLRSCSLCAQDDCGDVVDDVQEAPFIAAVHGGLSSEHSRRAKLARVLVSTPEMLLQDLIHAEVTMRDIGLLILDEAHHIAGKDQYSLLMKHFYWPTDPADRPRILAMTASPFKTGSEASLLRTQKAEKTAERVDVTDIDKQLMYVEELLDCDIWARSVEEYLPRTRQEWREFPSGCPNNRATKLVSDLQDAWAQCAPADETHRKQWTSLSNQLQEILRELGVWPAYTFVKALAASDNAVITLEETLTDTAEASDISARAKDLAYATLQDSVQGCLLKFQTIDEVGTELEETPEDYVTSKVLQLQAVLKEALAAGSNPKLLVFARMRVTAKLLFHFLHRSGSELEGKVAYVASARAGAWIGRISMQEQQAALAQFRLEGQGDPNALSILVTTSVLAEGINVASCSLVVRFDPPATVLDNIQTRGRARRDGAVYMHLLEESDVKHQQQLEKFETMEEELRKVMEQRSSRSSCREAGRRSESPQDVLYVPETGAKLPGERAKRELHLVYTRYITGTEETFFFSNEKFSDKTHFQVERLGEKQWRCRVILPVVGCCSVVMETKEEIEGEVAADKQEAKTSAALAAIRRLRELGVVDEHLYVAGRAQILESIGGLYCLRGHARVHRVDDAWAVRERTKVVRALPSCMKGNFEPRAELLAPIATTKANRQVLQEEVAEAAKASEAKGKAPKAEQLSEAGVTEAPEEAVADIAKGHVPTVEPAEVGEHGSEADHQVDSLGVCAFLHLLRCSKDEACNLALLLPAPVPAAVATFPIAVDRLDGAGELIPMTIEALQEPVLLSEQELQELEDWTHGAIVLAGATRMCASQSRLLRMRPMAGDYVPVEPEADQLDPKPDAGEDSQAIEAGRWLLAPMRSFQIDWNWVRWGLSCMTTTLWPSLHDILQKEVTGKKGSAFNIDTPLNLADGVTASTGELVVLHSDDVVQNEDAIAKGKVLRPIKDAQGVIRRRHLVFGALSFAVGSTWDVPDAEVEEEDVISKVIGLGEGCAASDRAAELPHLLGSLFRRSLAAASSSGARMAVSHLLKVKLPASTCRVLPLLYSQFSWIQRLPALLWRLEHVALIAELFETPSLDEWKWPLQLQVQVFTHAGSMVLPADMQSSQGEIASCGQPEALRVSYERLEFLGDAILKLLTMCFIASMKDRQCGEDVLSQESQKYLSNRYLHSITKKVLDENCFARKVNEILLVSPFDTRIPLSKNRVQTVSVKMQADVVEACLGASFVNVDPNSEDPLAAGIEQAQTFFREHVLLPRQANSTFITFHDTVKTIGLQWFKVLAIEGDQSNATIQRSERPKEKIKDILRYRFASYEDLLINICERTDGLRSPAIFQELECIGDAVLGGLVAAWLMRHLRPAADEGLLSQARSDLVSNTWLAVRMARRFPGDLLLEIFFGKNHPEAAAVEEFMEKVLEIGRESTDHLLQLQEDFRSLASINAPKCVADIYEALMALVFIDSHGDMDTTWKVFAKDFDVPAKLLVDHALDRRAKERQKNLSELKAVGWNAPLMSTEVVHDAANATIASGDEVLSS